MIGCLLLGTFVAMGAARLIHRHHGCGWRHGGGFGPPWRGMHGFHGHHAPHDHGGYGGPGGWFGREAQGGDGGYEPSLDGGWGTFGGNGGPPTRGRGFMNSMLGYVLGQVRATATQERVIRTAFEEFRDEMKEVGSGERKRTRQDIGAALRKAEFDEVFMGELFARQDTAIEKTRKAFVGLMARVHEVLDEEQRGRLAELVERGPRFWRRGFDW